MMRGALLFLGLAMLLTSPARAQVSGSCESGRAIAFVTNPTLQASVFNTGGLFFGGRTTSGDGYLIPKQTGAPPVFAANFWLGGKVEGELRVAAARFGSWDFWPGPLDAAAQPPADCTEHDRIYTVHREDLRRYYETGELARDLRDWPHSLGAPVLDGDGVEGNYNLGGGDQPDLIGDMSAWWVMNDAGGDHEQSSPEGPLGVEVRAQAFLYGELGEPISPALVQTMFIRYEVVNRNDQPIDSLFATIWADVDLGNPQDDYIGTDTLRNMVFVYNSSNVDTGIAEVGYGEAPPAWGVQVLHGPVGLANERDDDFDGAVDEPGERLGATSTSWSLNSGPSQFNDPFAAPEEFYAFMRGRWRDGTPITAFGDGYQTDGPETRFMFPGDPVTESFWSEVNTGAGRALNADRRMMISTGPFRLDPGSSATLIYAMPYGRGSDHLQSVAVLRSIATSLAGLPLSAFSGTPVDRQGQGSEARADLALTRVNPNPSSGRGAAVLTLPTETHIRATVYDVLGRQLEVLVDGELPEGPTELAMPDGLATGTYLLRVEVAPGAVETIPFTVVR